MRPVIATMLMMAFFMATMLLADEQPQLLEEDEAADCDCQHKPSSQQQIGRSSMGKVEKFDISTLKPNYVLPMSYNFKPNESQSPYPQGSMDKGEMEFQFSLKLLVTERLPWDTDLYVAYTNHSFWQAYNSELSSPFRETNHEPEVFTRTPIDFSLGDWQIQNIELGFVHQSNGRSIPWSRSWNRLYFNITSQYKDFHFALKPWYRLKEEAKDDAWDTTGDDNPDIEEYLGRFEFLTAYHFHGQTLSLVARNGLGIDDKGSTELTWSYPIAGEIDLYLKYFYGYGRSLIDYDHKSNAIGIGFSISDW